MPLFLHMQKAVFLMTCHDILCYSEADPLVGWSKDELWRADSTYAAMVTKVSSGAKIIFLM